MAAKDFCDSIDTWIRALSRYSEEDLRAQPSSQAWSIGQVYMHLLNETSFFIEQAKICIATSANAQERASATGTAILRNNSLGDARLQGPPGNDAPLQPAGHRQLQQSLTALQHELRDVYAAIDQNAAGGKTKHPGFDYFSASEWLQFAHIHLRHHLKQKERLDLFIESNR